MKNKFDTNSLEEIVDENSQILILGTVPGNNSNTNKQYYNDNRNYFWKIIYSIFDKIENIPQSYEEKKQFLYKYRIALWDVYSGVNRGPLSLDKYIKSKDSGFNDIKNLLIKYPNIKKILLNGGKAKRAFKKYLKQTENINCKYEYVLSSSGGNTRYSFDDKVKCWKKAINE